jgi:2-dehydropantoate 2-reductase
MLQDVDAKRITEVDMLAGKMIDLGKAYGIPVPMNEVLYKVIKAIEANYVNLA